MQNKDQIMILNLTSKINNAKLFFILFLPIFFYSCDGHLSSPSKSCIVIKNLYDGDYAVNNCDDIRVTIEREVKFYTSVQSETGPFERFDKTSTEKYNIIIKKGDAEQLSSDNKSLNYNLHQWSEKIGINTYKVSKPGNWAVTDIRWE